MKVIGQPENYSEMLERIFVTTLVTGFLCTVWLGIVLPDVRNLLALLNTPADVGPIKGIKVLYLVIPMMIALTSRIIKLHDRVSDLLGMRRAIDLDWILSREANAVGVQLDDAFRTSLRETPGRRRLMGEVFYDFVTLPDAKIDKQLVRSALDNLGWMWSFVEAAVVVLLTSIVFVVRGEFSWSGVGGGVVLVLVACSVAMWFACRRTSTAEVDAILTNPERCQTIRASFVNAMRGDGVKPEIVSEPVKTPSTAALDLFISHASEDKAEVARPLYEALIKEGLSVWFDEATLELGDSLRKKIDDGLARCRYGIVILSPTFLSKQWTQMELDGLVSRETASGDKAILPIWHKIDHATLVQRSPMLAGRLAASTTDGIDELVVKILRVVRKR